MAQRHFFRAASVGAGVLVVHSLEKMNEDNKLSCSPGTTVEEEKLMMMEVEKQQQRVTEKLMSGQSKNAEEQKLLDLMQSVKSGELSASEGIEELKKAMFQKYQPTYEKHPCGKALQGYHECFFEKTYNQKESTKDDKNKLLECKDPHFLALQSCMFEQTDKVRNLIRAKMGDEVYKERFESSGKNAIRKMIAVATKRNENDIDDTEVDKAYAETQKQRQMLEKDVQEFRNRTNSQKQMEEQKEINEKSPNMSETKSWWKFGR